MHNDELCHYGVKGMKWGVRKEEKIRSMRSQYHSKVGTANTHYRSAIKWAEKAKDETLSKKDRKYAAKAGAHQYGKGEEYNKQARKIKNKMVRNKANIQDSPTLLKTRAEAGELYVKKWLPRRLVESGSQKVSAGMQFALQTALLGRPMVAVTTEYSKYKLKK